MDVKVEYHKLDYPEFGYLNKELYNQMYYMSKNYGFYFSGFCVNIRDTDMTEYALKRHKNHKHKFILYNIRETDRFYLIQYCKSLIKIYYCYDGKYRTIINNLNRAYKKGREDAWKETEYKSNDTK